MGSKTKSQFYSQEILVPFTAHNPHFLDLQVLTAQGVDIATQAILPNVKTFQIFEKGSRKLFFDREYQKVVHAVFHEIVAARWLVSGFRKFLEHDVAVNAMVLGTPVAIDDADLRAGA